LGKKQSDLILVMKKVFIEGPVSSSFIADSIAKHSTKKEIGAHSIFLGQVRNDQINDKIVSAIEYTTYEEMANAQLHLIRDDTFSKFDLTCMHIYHSLGTVKAGEICLFVFTSSKHRKQAIDACEYVVERIKKEVSIWGKEIFEDDTYVWKENR
jgi:molybdopterin synthase catalytic subunit